MFKKILIANRGEIAVRIIQTCKRMGIGTVAVFSDADSRSLHVQLADEAVGLGGVHGRESYLNIDKVLNAAKSTGCAAVHPGYGFLSENPRFADAVAMSGLTFIGPSARAIELMGDKIASKELAKKAGVPVIPGYIRALADVGEALAAAEKIGYPVLLKPAAGGGGKGMRIVYSQADMTAAFSAGRQETQKAFADDRLFIERYIERPRHVEIQVFGDSHGNVVYLGERECSVQRRYQKIIEESPSPALDEELRTRMGKAAVDLALTAGYVNAGTVEFVLDSQREFYFLEMNTRLQVEHPVTERVTGLDLVELQLRVAAGECLPFDQKGVVLNGWAMEARICAEDPSRQFTPSTGMITRYAEPKGNEIRVDSGVQTGSKIAVYYDSLLAKVICGGKDREEARTRLVEALNGYHIEGVTTNIDFANSILCHPEFIRGDLSTGFLTEYFEGDRPNGPVDGESIKLAALAATIIYHVRIVAVRESLRPMVSRIGGKRRLEAQSRYIVRSEDDVFDIILDGTMAGRFWTIRVNGHRYAVETPEFEFYRRRLKLIVDGKVHRFRLYLIRSFIKAAFNGTSRLFECYSPKEWELMKFMPARVERAAENVMVCPMPGLVVDVLVKPGDRVFRGQNLVIIESMKMESGVASPCDGVVAEIEAQPGQAVEAEDVLVRFES